MGGHVLRDGDKHNPTDANTFQGNINKLEKVRQSRTIMWHENTKVVLPKFKICIYDLRTSLSFFFLLSCTNKLPVVTYEGLLLTRGKKQ